MENSTKGKDHAPGQNKEQVIIVNGKPKSYEGKKISYEEVVILAFGDDAFNEQFNYIVMYSKGNQDKPKGTLVAGESVKVKHKMIFNVKRTIRS